MLGNNMFAYCGNNPVVRDDALGASFAIVLGFNLNLFGLGGIGTINFVSTKKDLGVQYSYYLPDDAKLSEQRNQTVGVDVGPYIGVQYTDEDSLDDLTGIANASGGDICFGFDILKKENGEYLGWQFGASAISCNMHSLYTDTVTLVSIPTLDIPTILIEWMFGGN